MDGTEEEEGEDEGSSVYATVWTDEEKEEEEESNGEDNAADSVWAVKGKEEVDSQTAAELEQYTTLSTLLNKYRKKKPVRYVRSISPPVRRDATILVEDNARSVCSINTLKLLSIVIVTILYILSCMSIISGTVWNNQTTAKSQKGVLSDAAKCPLPDPVREKARCYAHKKKRTYAKKASELESFPSQVT